MGDTEHVMISLEPQLTALLLSGEKSVELRRRRVRVQRGARVWIYSKLPMGRVEAVAVVKNIIEASPNELWTRFRECLGISRSEFDTYLRDRPTAFGIVLGEVTRLNDCVDLKAMRTVAESFQPPQFYRRLRRGSAELTLCLTALERGVGAS